MYSKLNGDTRGKEECGGEKLKLREYAKTVEGKQMPRRCTLLFRALHGPEI